MTRPMARRCREPRHHGDDGVRALEDGRTLVSISEEGWRETPKGLEASYGNCEGWTGMLAALRIWLEHGINFREGYYK